MNAANPSSSICRYMNPVNVTDNVNSDVVVFVVVLLFQEFWSKDVVKSCENFYGQQKWQLPLETGSSPTRLWSNSVSGHGSLAPHLQHQRTPKASKDSLEVFFGGNTTQVAPGNLKKSIKVHPTYLTSTASAQSHSQYQDSDRSGATKSSVLLRLLLDLLQL